MKRAAVALVGLLAAPGALRAQSGVRAMAALSGEATRFESVNPSATERLNGAALAAKGRLGLGPIVLEVQYLDGKIGPAGSAAKNDLVEGSVTLAVRVVPWLTIGAGPHARAVVANAGTERWLAIEAHARAETPLLAPALVSSCDVWRAFGGSVNFGGAFGGGQGVEAGLSLRPPRVPLSVTVAYRLERSTLSGGARSDTVEHLVVQIGFGRF